MTGFQEIERFMLQKLEKELPANLSYHGIHHTLDVLNASLQIAHAENISGQDITLLRIAALFHDSGFIHVYQGHEKIGCDLVRESLPSFGFGNKEIDIICGMIMATKVPQSPVSLLEKILCDADLDYLGRDDYYPISRQLYKEFLEHGIVHNEEEWNRLQVNFLESHHYHTQYSQRVREPMKQCHLARIREAITTC